MPQLTERQIQKKTISFLEDYYNRKYKPESLTSTMHPGLKTTHCRFKIDALINFDSSELKGHTVAVETKSFCDLKSRLSFSNYKHPLYLLAAVTSAVITSFLRMSLAGYQSLLLMATLLLVFCAVIYLIKRAYRKNRTKRIVNEVSEIPSNEKWFAITRPGLNLLKQKATKSYINAYDLLLTQCLKKKIGILLVTQDQIEILQKPRFTMGRHLKYYYDTTTKAQLSNISYTS